MILENFMSEGFFEKKTANTALAGKKVICASVIGIVVRDIIKIIESISVCLFRYDLPLQDCGG